MTTGWDVAPISRLRSKVPTPMYATTVNDPALAWQLHGWGADSIISDSPGALRAALEGW